MRHHLIVPVPEWHDLPAHLMVAPVGTAIYVDGGNTLMIVAANAEHIKRPIVVWIVLDDEYGAPMAARDVATLSWLTDLEGVIVSRPLGRAEENAEVMRALLSGDDVTVSSTDVTVTSAYNRPLPPNPLQIWTAEDHPTADRLTLTPIGDHRDVEESVRLIWSD